LNTPKILITGATGFVGGAVLKRLRSDRRFALIAAARRWDGPGSEDLVFHRIGSLSGDVSWGGVVDSVDTVIHCAARVHVMNEHSVDPLGAFRAVNVNATLNLARQAAAGGVRRFIFISSIKVNGESTVNGQAFSASDEPAPEDAYGLSKLEAEKGLIQLATETGMEVVIIRPPLVYGPGVKGNFASMARLVEKGLPLPFGAINNKRSLVSIDNLVDLIIRCIEHPEAANQIFLAGDGEDLSTTELLRSVAKALDKPARLIPVPVGFLEVGAALLGKKAMAQRLLGSLQVDISRTCELLGWKPPHTVVEGLKRCFERSN
jgi:nucleoside-diphosphate-sugar epimerase